MAMSAQCRSSVAITASRVSYSYGKGRQAVNVLSNINLQISYGECVAITGPSGSGKTTLLNILAGAVQPDGGLIVWNDKEGSEVSSEQLVRTVYQDFRLVSFLSALENVRLAQELANCINHSLIDDLMGRLGLAGLENRLPAELSGGEQQRVALVRALATSGSILLADEPTGALDSSNSAELATLLTTLARDHGLAVLVATHDPLVEAAASRSEPLRNLTLK